MSHNESHSLIGNILAGIVLIIIAAGAIAGLITYMNKEGALKPLPKPSADWVLVAPGLYKVSDEFKMLGEVICYRLRDGDGMTSLSCVRR